MLGMRVCGKITKLMGKVNFGMLMVIYMRVNGLLIRLMDEELILISMVHSTLEIGRTTFNTARVSKPGQMDPNTTEITLEE